MCHIEVGIQEREWIVAEAGIVVAVEAGFVVVVAVGERTPGSHPKFAGLSVDRRLVAIASA